MPSSACLNEPCNHYRHLSFQLGRALCLCRTYACTHARPRPGPSGAHYWLWSIGFRRSPGRVILYIENFKVNKSRPTKTIDAKCDFN
jgi:hypothetical protein